jgi:putative hemolysin
MNSLLPELVIILVLLLANGFFSMAEIAVVSSNRARLRHLANQGDRRSAAALALAEEPNRFLSTVQIGITLVGVIAAAFSGATFASALARPMQEVPWLAAYAEEVSFAVVVSLLTFLTLVLGELLPKRVGLSNPEGIARAVAPSMRRLSSIGGPVVALLGACTQGLMNLLGIKPRVDTPATDEEIALLVTEGSRAGQFHKNEPEMVRSVMALDKVLTRELMTPRTRIIWVSVNDTAEMLWHKVVVSGHSTFPVYETTQDNILGVISVKSIYANTAAGIPHNIRSLVRPPTFVPATLPATTLLETFQSTTRHTALVLDEFGGITGLVTLHDLMEAIVGDLPTVGDLTRPTALKTEDGKWLVDGMLDTEGFEELVPAFELPPEEERDYQTIAGFVMKHLGRVPAEGEQFDYSGYRVQILDLDGYRIDKLLFMPLPGPGGATPEEIPAGS